MADGRKKESKEIIWYAVQEDGAGNLFRPPEIRLYMRSDTPIGLVYAHRMLMLELLRICMKYFFRNWRIDGHPKFSFSTDCDYPPDTYGYAIRAKLQYAW